MVGYDDSIADLEFAHITPSLDDFAGDLVTENRWLLQLLKPDLMNIRKTNPTSLDLKQQVPFVK